MWITYILTFIAGVILGFMVGYNPWIRKSNALDKDWNTSEDKSEDEDEMIPAIPPDDYKGSQADWMISLQERGLWDGKDPEWHGDVMIPTSVWWEILEECEGDG